MLMKLTKRETPLERKNVVYLQYSSLCEICQTFLFIVLFMLDWTVQLSKTNISALEQQNHQIARSVNAFHPREFNITRCTRS